MKKMDKLTIAIGTILDNKFVQYFLGKKEYSICLELKDGTPLEETFGSFKEFRAKWDLLYELMERGK